MNYLFITGLPRTGTTLLANKLMAYKQVSSCHSELHYGVKELNMYQFNKWFLKFPLDIFHKKFKDTDVASLIKYSQVSLEEIREMRSFYELLFCEISLIADLNSSQFTSSSLS